MRGPIAGTPEKQINNEMLPGERAPVEETPPEPRLEPTARSTVEAVPFTADAPIPPGLRVAQPDRHR